jgi:hypothetical protein
MRQRYGGAIYRRYGFVDSFNPTLDDPRVTVRKGKVYAGLGWFDDDHLGIDQGPIVAMIENHRSGLVWNTMRASQAIGRGLRRADFTTVRAPSHR